MSLPSAWASWRPAARWSLLFLAVALPLAFYLRTYYSVMVKTTVLQLGTLLALAVWASGSLEEGRFELPAAALPVLAPAFLLLCWNAARFALGGHRFAALEGFLLQEAFLAGFALTVVLFSKRELRLAVMAAAGAWSIVVLYALAQRCGLDPFIWKGAFGARVFSTLGNPDFLAAYLVCCAPLALSLVLDDDLPLWLQGLAAGCSLLAGAVVAWTGSALQIALYAVEMGVFAALAGRAFGRARGKMAVGLAALCLLACLGSAASSRSVTGERYGLGHQASFVPETWKASAALALDRPLLGCGPGSFWVRYPAFRHPAAILLEHKHNVETDHAENEYLEQWAEGGAIGALLWLWLFAGLVTAGWRRARRGAGAQRPYLVGALAAVIGALLSMTVSVGSRFVVPGWIMYFVAGLLATACFGGAEAGPVAAVPLPAGLAVRRALLLPLWCVAAWLGWYSARMFRSDVDHNIAIYWSKNEKWDRALEAYDREVPGSPAYVMGQYFKGNVLQDSGDSARAAAQFAFVRLLAPDYVAVHFQEAKALRALGRKAQAIAQLEAETRVDPTWDEPWRALAELYAEMGEAPRAAAANQRAAAAKRDWQLAAAR